VIKGTTCLQRAPAQQSPPAEPLDPLWLARLLATIQSRHVMAEINITSNNITECMIILYAS
jgi:hypothetical protein